MAFSFASLTALFRGENTKFSSKDGVIGLDIGTSSIKVIQINEVGGLPTLKTYGEILLGPYENGDLSRTTHLPAPILTAALADILKESDVSTDTVTYALAYDSSFVTTVTLPAIEESQIATMIPVEARKYVPAVLSEVKLDWFPIASDIEKHATKVFISATYTEALNRYQAVCEGNNLRPLSNEHEAFSSIRSLLSEKDTSVAVVDFGASSTRMYIIERGVIEKTHSIPFSGTGLTNALKSGLSISFKEAEETKRAYGISHSQYADIQKILTKELERGIRELHTVCTRFEKEEGKKIERTIITGGGALLKGINEYMQTIFTHLVDRGAPFSKIAYPAYLEDVLKDTGPSFTVAIGVALSSFEKKG